MKTQNSRDSHVSKKRYSGVYQQQGRMITDADWNELVDLVKQRLADALKDVIGSGIPNGLERGLAIEENSGAIKIRPGHVYIDGIKGELISDQDAINFDAQEDFPYVPLPGISSRIYADVWERVVVSLEDENLRDPGLHGADTCSRTQTMVQIKWCANSLDPEADRVVNPKIGDAISEFGFHDQADSVDRVDPCLTEAVEQPRIGNYLFRVEIHDVQYVQAGDAVPERITLKWSSENGAEHYHVDKTPMDYTSGSWVYDFYDDDTERHLGHHLVSGFVTERGVLREDMDSIPRLGSGASDRDTKYVRRWDGACTLERSGTSWDLAMSEIRRDKETVLNPGNASGTPGYVNVTADELEVVLESLVHKLTLSRDKGGGTEPCQFVAGDYWLAMVREEAATDPEDLRVTTLNDGLPIGIEHNYLLLAKLDGGGALQSFDAGSDKDRQLNFPVLTNLSADRIAYAPDSTQARWEDIKESPLGDPPHPNTVQEAIDDLVENLESSDISYKVPDCPGSADTVRGRLPTISGLGNNDPLALNILLTALLCELTSDTIPYESNPGGDSIKDLLIKKTGDTMTGPLTIDDGAGDPDNVLTRVNGTVYMDGFKMDTGSPANNDVLTYDQPTGKGVWRQSAGGGWVLVGGDLSTDSSNVTGTITIGNPPTAAIRINTSGNVGIGTIQPDIKLHIANGTDANLNNGSGYMVLGNVDSHNIVVDNNEMMARNNGAISTLYFQAEGGDFYVHSNKPGDSSKFIIKDNGKVGIGTPSPAEALHVEGNIFVTGTIYSGELVHIEEPNILTVSTNDTQYDPNTFQPILSPIPQLSSSFDLPSNRPVSVNVAFAQLQIENNITTTGFVNNDVNLKIGLYVDGVSKDSLNYIVEVGDTNTYTNLSLGATFSPGAGMHTVEVRWVLTKSLFVAGDGTAQLNGTKILDVTIS